jgi:hypothetical protein
VTNDEIGQILIEISDRHGKLTPAIVIEEATSENHPFHDQFEWDNEIAGHQHRLTQAKTLIKVAKISESPNLVSNYRAPMFVRDPDSSAKDGGYVALAKIPSESEQARNIYAMHLQRVINAMKSLEKVAGVLGMDQTVKFEIERLTATLVPRTDIDQPAAGNA